jgi:uncharacterized membrane protein YqjE
MSMREGEAEKRQESVSELIKDLSRDISDLVRQEIELARAEMMEKGKKAGIGAGMFGGAALMGAAAVGGSMATIIIVLDLWMPLWLAALITTVLYAAVAAVLAMRGRDELRQTGTPIPEKTKESVKEDIQWAKTRAQSNSR